MVRSTLIVLSLLVVLIVSFAVVPALAQTYVTRSTVTTNGFLPTGAINPNENCVSFIIRSSPAGLNGFLASLRGLPTGAARDFVCSYDLRANGTYTLDLGNAFGATCRNFVLYKVNFNASAGEYKLATCVGDVLTINHRGSDATFLIFEV